jgi:hypothetical protein
MILFLLWMLLSQYKNILIVSHSVFLDTINESQYYERPENCRPYVIEHTAIIKFFRRVRDQGKAKL